MRRGSARCAGSGGRPLNNRRRLKSHGDREQRHCPGLHHRPGRPPRNPGECPHPEKSRYATEDAAWRSSKGRAFVAGLVLSPYECVPGCGWWHLTKRVIEEESR